MYTFFLHEINSQSSVESIPGLLSLNFTFCLSVISLENCVPNFPPIRYKNQGQFQLGYLGFPVLWVVFLFLVGALNGLLRYFF